MSTDETIVTKIGTLNSEGEKKPCLTFITGPRLGQIHNLNKTEIVVGRSPDCELWIEDSAISRKHFKVVTQGQEVEVCDMGSTNGTYVNGKKVSRALLQDGDKIQISQDTILELTYLDESRLLSEKKRYEMGVMDPVTNIYNKRYLLDRLKEEFSFAQRKNRNLSIIMFDIDHFKVTNDTYGHLAGDLVLQKLAAEVAQTIRSDDVLARYGGEEFVIVMRDASLKNATELAERLRQVVAKTEVPYEGQTIRFTISLGIAIRTSAMNDYVDLIAVADKYLYRSKKQGRNRVSGPESEAES